MKSDYKLKDTDEVLSDNTKLQIGDTIRFIEINEYSSRLRHILLNCICEIINKDNEHYIEVKILLFDHNITNEIKDYDATLKYTSVLDRSWALDDYNLIKTII